MRAIIYGRVSTEEQRKESIDAQLAQCRELCSRERFAVVRELSDFGISGADPNRPGYQALLRAIRAHEADVIVAHELSRLWRNEAEMHAVMDELAYLKKHVVCLVGGIDTRIADLKILISLLGAVAAHESKQTAIRTHSRLKDYVTKGASSGGGKCYGYAVDAASKTAKRAIDPDQAAVVVEIFERYAAGHRRGAEPAPRPLPGGLLAPRRAATRREVARVGDLRRSEARVGDLEQPALRRPLRVEPLAPRETLQDEQGRV